MCETRDSASRGRILESEALNMLDSAGESLTKALKCLTTTTTGAAVDQIMLAKTYMIECRKRILKMNEETNAR